MTNTQQFNLNQQEAINWNSKPLLVLAGPGSGKTMVLTYRAARILQEYPDSSILALTFTTKAADEMRERLNKLLGERTERAHLCTFHSFAGDILRQHGSHVGIHPDFSLLTRDEDKIPFVDDALKIMRREGKFDMQTITSDRKNLLTLLEKLFAFEHKNIPNWLRSFFDIYCNELINSNRLDFGTLLYFAKQLLTTHKAVANLIRASWEYICVDEFQDTNKAQYDLLRLLVPNKNGNLFIVGDEDQIIYQWNGTSPKRLLELQTEYDLNVIQLPENYRCPPEIIEMANLLIAHNQTRSSNKKPLKAKKISDNSEVVSAVCFQDEDEEVNDIVSVIQKKQWSYDDCVVMARTTKLLEKAANSLKKNGISSYLMKRKNEFESPAVVWMYSILRLALSRHDYEFLRRVCSAWRLLTNITIEIDEVETQAAIDKGDFLRSWVSLAMNTTTDEKLSNILFQIQEQLVDRVNFLDLLQLFWKTRQTDGDLENDDLEMEELKTWEELHESLLAEYSQENITLNLYLQELDMKSKAPEQRPNSVRCITVHGAKGLEFKHVFLIGMSDGVFPTFQAVQKGNDSEEMEEERRNCFVAITRVQETLNISFSNQYNGYAKSLSRFLREMGFTIEN
jgi:DNA helicase-2/ATP-dependent DNA helicase PcrA